MRTLSIEVVTESLNDALQHIETLGGTLLPGFQPVPMPHQNGRPDSTILTVNVPESASAERFDAIRGVVGVFGDSQIAPFGSTR